MTLPWGLGRFATAWGTNALDDPFLSDAVGPVVAGLGRPYHQEDSGAAFDDYQDAGLILCAGARHDGSALTTLGTVHELSIASPASPLAAERPWWTQGGRDVARWSTAVEPTGFYTAPSWTFAQLETGSARHSLSTTDLWRSLFDGRPSADRNPTVVGTPSAGSTTLRAGNFYVSAPRFDAWRLVDYRGAWSTVARFGGDPVRYAVTVATDSDVDADGLEPGTLSIAPALQASTATAIAGGNSAVEWLPRFEIPTDTPFDILVASHTYRRPVDGIADPADWPTGWLCFPQVYWSQYEPRSWYT